MRFMKSFLIMMVMLSLILPAALEAVEAQRLDHASIQVTLQSYEPFPAEPGSVVSLKFRATNIGGSRAQQPSFELAPEYPFAPLEGQNIVKEFGEMAPRESVTFEYRVRVADDAPIGQSPVRIRHSVDGSSWIASKHDIMVRIEESILSVGSVVTEPDMLPPGGVSTIGIKLENSGSTTLRDISLKLDFDAPIEAGLQEILPFAPSGSTGEKRIRSIEGGETKHVEFDIMTFSDASSGVYRLPIRLMYRGDSGEMRTRSDSIGLMVGSEPRLSATLDSIDYRPGNTELSFRIVNRGVTDLKFVNARMGRTNGYELLSPSDEFYIGRLSSDDFDSISFKVNLDEDSGKVTIPFHLEYLDANNREHTEQFDIEIDLDIVRRTSTQEGGSALIIVILLAAAGIGIYLRRRKRRQRRR